MIVAMVIAILKQLQINPKKITALLKKIVAAVIVM